MDHFTPYTALAGGSLIGLGAALLWIGNGRIAGISGLAGGLLPPHRFVPWRLSFLVAMVVGAFMAAHLLDAFGIGGGATTPKLAGDPLVLAIAGLLTGLGTRIGNGCTSGHGVCGLARLSPRSFVAVGVFFAVAMATVALHGGF